MNDLTNQIFHRLTVTSFSHLDLRNRPYWNCLCICGKTKKCRGQHLLSGNIQSCGCLRGQNMKDLPVTEHSALSSLYAQYKCDAQRHEHTFELTFNEAVSLFKNNCYYCGDKPSRLQKTNGRSTAFVNGIDRKENEVGYTVDNCVSCCKVCNQMKNSRNHDEFLEWIKLVYVNTVI